MVMVEIDGNKWYEDKKWLANLDIMLDAMQDNDDLVIIFCGKERAGKSLRMRQVGAYCANYLGTKFDRSNIKFDLQEYMDHSIESPQYTVNILDEARNQLSRKKANSRLSVKFTNFLSECGKYNQVHLIALPAFHDLDKNVVLWRNKFVVLVHKWYEADSTKKSGYSLKRGRFTLYMNDDNLKKCYLYPYTYPRKWEVRGVFNNVEVLTDEELKDYEEKKDGNIENRYHSKSEEEELGKREDMWRSRALRLAENCELMRGITPGEIADGMGIEVSNYNKLKQRYGQKTKEN